MDGPIFPESDLSPEERLDAVAAILLRGVRRLAAERGRTMTLRRVSRRQACRPAAGGPARRSARLPPAEIPVERGAMDAELPGDLAC